MTKRRRFAGVTPIGPPWVGAVAVAWPFVIEDGARLRCPYCESYGVQRLYLASVRLDACECSECGARWDEEPATGAFRGRGSRHSIVDRSLRR